MRDNDVEGAEKKGYFLYFFPFPNQRLQFFVHPRLLLSFHNRPTQVLTSLMRKRQNTEKKCFVILYFSRPL